MRKAFEIEFAGTPYAWRELSWGHTLKLNTFFRDVLDDKIVSFAKEDGRDVAPLSGKEYAAYDTEARYMMYSLRDFWDINHVLPLAAGLGLPNMVRLTQSPKDESTGFFNRFHIAVLEDPSRNRIVGLSTLERTKEPSKAELCFWKHTAFDRIWFLLFVGRFMSWSQEKAGYTDFIAHVEKKAGIHRENTQALRFAASLGFAETGERITTNKGTHVRRHGSKEKITLPPEESIRSIASILETKDWSRESLCFR